MFQVLRYLVVGMTLSLGVVIGSFVAGSFLGGDWQMMAIIGLVIVGAITFALVFVPTPAQSDLLPWSEQIPFRGEGFDVVGGGLFGGRTTVGPHRVEFNRQAIINSAVPIFIAAGLACLWLFA